MEKKYCEEICRLLCNLPLDKRKALSLLLGSGSSQAVRKRGFEIIERKKDEKIRVPQRATPGSGGYDIWPLEDVTLQPGQDYSFNTGIKAYMPADEILLINIRSSYGIKHGIQLCNEQGWIDSDYYSNEENDGEIIIAVKNNGAYPFIIKKDNPFAQGLFINYLLADDDRPRLTERKGGIGHTSE